MENQDVILLVDDDCDLCEVLKCYLERNGLEVHTAYNGADAYDAIHELHPRVIVLDVEMPELDGFQLAMMLRKEGNTIPVLFMSGRQEADAALKAFDLGADDYIRKEITPDELLARIRLRLKHQKEEPGVFTIGSYTYNSQTKELRNSTGIITVMTPLQGRIFELLCRNTGKAVSREMFYKIVWEQTVVDSRALDVHISNLRKYFEGDPCIEIRKDYSLGYQIIVK